ncbi:hypothetical protein MOQ11_02875 [Stenotrophomonas maltophilia]|uniref:hypothetical protein n=1 Tax=Stenotrophomonas maltophilia TaxID=40324 RepID=UPI001311AF06|nr:hypothetical protein [Stenotrophomonas maltophilia]MBH1664539.1 hypothetical protein [Stenotrophomonas maltophilia]MCI1130813.1 hypothetical protein [Stenotrophomonas maltophilia]
MSLDYERKRKLVAALKQLAKDVEEHGADVGSRYKFTKQLLNEVSIQKGFEEVVVSMESFVLQAAGKPCSKCNGSGRE